MAQPDWNGNTALQGHEYFKLRYLALASPILFFAFYACKVIYRIYFHPLSSYPGPKLAAATRLWYIYKLYCGELPQTIAALHREYGSVLRVAPDELTYTSSDSWKDIYGFRSGKPEMAKESPFYKVPTNFPSIITAERNRHGHFRKLMSRGFSDSALREQEPIIQNFVTLLMQRLRERSDRGEAVNMVSWFNFITFDIIGDLAFGEPFGCLRDSGYHPWVKLISESVKFIAMATAANYYPTMLKLLPLIVPKSTLQKYTAHREMTKEMALRRKESKLDRADFVSNLIKPESGITDQELIGNTETLIVAGSETTASLLSAVTYLLCRNPASMRKAVAEVRSSFTDLSEITFTNINRLEYMLACLNEAFRLIPPAQTGLPRVVPKGGDIIDGRFVPEGTNVSIFQRAANTIPANFKRPMEYIPERWLGDSEFVDDDRAAMQPFVIGPRNCLGKNLAYVEMRVILARLLWEFDLKLCDGMEDWDQAKVYLVMDKRPLMVKLSSVR